MNCNNCKNYFETCEQAQELTINMPFNYDTNIKSTNAPLGYYVLLSIKLICSKPGCLLTLIHEVVGEKVNGKIDEDSIGTINTPYPDNSYCTLNQISPSI